MKKYIILTLIAILLPISLISQTRVKMKYDRGIYTIPCKVNGLPLEFIFDTGASSVSISQKEAVQMLEKGLLEKRDFVGRSKGIIADGSSIINTQINIREIEIGGHILTNVRATIVHNINAPLLLGQSAIQQLGAIQLDGDQLVILNKKTSSVKQVFITEEGSIYNIPQDQISAFKSQYPKAIQPTKAQLDAKMRNYIVDAKTYERRNQYEQAADKFKVVYEIDPTKLNSNDLALMAECCIQIGDYNQSINYLNSAVATFERTGDTRGNANTRGKIYFDLAMAYYETEDYTKAFTMSRKSSDIYTKYNLPGNRDEGYFLMGKINFQLKETTKALEMYQKAFSYKIQQKYGSTTNLDLMSKSPNFQDEFLGKCLLEMARCHTDMGNQQKAGYCIETAAKYGNRTAKNLNKPFKAPSIK